MAGIPIEVHCCYDTTKNLCADYIENSADYRKPSIKISITDDDIVDEWKRSSQRQQIWYGEKYYESYALHRRICESVIEYDTILMHGAVVAYQGLGYMFTAASGVGKSTRARIWLEEYPGSYFVNGDKPLIQVMENEILAYGTPWSGKEHWGMNTYIPLHAIYIIERADNVEENMIQRLNTDNSYTLLLAQTYIPDDIEKKKKTLGLLKAITNKVRIYHFRCKPTAEAIHMAYTFANES